MGLREVLAGLLLEGPAHGYRLHATLEAELGPLWQTRASQVYLTLGRMERDGLASSRRVRQATRPDRQLLELTERGRALAERWLSGPGAPDEAVVRLAVGRLVAPGRFRALATGILDERSAALRALRALRAAAGPGFPREAIDAEILRAQADVRWLAALRDRAAEVAVAPRGHRKGDGQVARPA